MKPANGNTLLTTLISSLCSSVCTVLISSPAVAKGPGIAAREYQSGVSEKVKVVLQTGALLYKEDHPFFPVVYSSRSLHEGLLGPGWCSPLDLGEECPPERLGLERIQRNSQGLVESYVYKNKKVIVKKTSLIVQNQEIPLKKNREQSRLLRLGDLEFAYRDGLLSELNPSNPTTPSKETARASHPRFLYDQFRNLRAVNQTVPLMFTYDSERDLVTQISTGPHCAESFAFLQETATEHRSLALLRCAGHRTELVSAQFSYQRTLEQKLRLQEMNINTHAGVTGVSRHAGGPE